MREGLCGACVGVCEVCGACVGRVWVCVGACVAWGRGRGGENVSLAALLSGYLGKSGHLPRCTMIRFDEIKSLLLVNPNFFGAS